MLVRHRNSYWNMVGIAASLLLLFWVADSFVDGVVFSEGDFVQQLLHPEAKELAYRLQTFLFLIFLVVYQTFEKHLNSGPYS